MKKQKTRKAVEYREISTREEKEDILKKTNGVCAHCGRKLTIGVNFTKEHFIPLNKGGTNAFKNLLPLCEDCNKNKANYIIHPYDYYNYLEDQYMDELLQEYAKYTKNVAWQSIKNFMQEDKKIISYHKVMKIDYSRKKGQAVSGYIAKGNICKIDEEQDIEEITNKIYKVYKARGKEISKTEIKNKLIEYLESGCIYKVCNGLEIVAIIPIMLEQTKKDEDSYYIFSIKELYTFYQKRDYIELILKSLVYILKGLSFISNNYVFWKVGVYKNDDYSKYIINYFDEYKVEQGADDIDNYYYMSCTIGTNEKKIEVNEEDIPRLYKEFSEVVEKKFNLGLSNKQVKKMVNEEKKKKNQKAYRRSQREEREYISQFL